MRNRKQKDSDMRFLARLIVWGLLVAAALMLAIYWGYPG